MKTKLTLSVQPDIIRKARRLSKKGGKSVSALFEDLVKHHERMTTPAKESSFIDRITGSIKDSGISHSEMRKEFRADKLNRK